MQFTAAQIAGLLNGQIEGDANATVTKLAKIEEGVPGSISFLANPLYTQYLYTSQASIIIINNDFVLTGACYRYVDTCRKSGECLCAITGNV